MAIPFAFFYLFLCIVLFIMFFSILQLCQVEEPQYFAEHVDTIRMSMHYR